MCIHRLIWGHVVYVRLLVMSLGLLYSLTIYPLVVAAEDPIAPEHAEINFEQVEQKVSEAAEYLAESGENALAEFSAGDTKWAREPHVFVTSMEGVVLAHPTNPKIIGRSLLFLRDVKGKKFQVEMLDIAKNQGSGWITYWWNRPTELEPSQKKVYVKKVDGQSFYVGAGAYLSK